MNLSSQKILFTKFRDFYQNHDKLIFYSLSASMVILITEVLLITLKYSLLPRQIPLFYSLPWGQSQLADVSQIVILPAVVILVLLTNSSFAWYLNDSQLILKRILALSSLILSLLLLITTWGIVSIFT